MNQQLKTLNKKILLLNEVMTLNCLFAKTIFNQNEQYFAQKRLTVLLKDKTTNMIYFAEKDILKIATDLRAFFFNKEVVIKRKVVNDRLISVYLQDPTTKAIMPLNPDAFIKMVEKIKLKEI